MLEFRQFNRFANSLSVECTKLMQSSDSPVSLLLRNTNRHDDTAVIYRACSRMDLTTAPLQCYPSNRTVNHEEGPHAFVPLPRRIETFKVVAKTRPRKKLMKY
ncbi:hypothetical protein NL676_001219 [Syzygium grande]|nr:hypothetical protein NL676_001219 [Syzygium grande]